MDYGKMWKVKEKDKRLLFFILRLLSPEKQIEALDAYEKGELSLLEDVRQMFEKQEQKIADLSQQILEVEDRRIMKLCKRLN